MIYKRVAARLQAQARRVEQLSGAKQKSETL